jgi:hypothetical protein
MFGALSDQHLCLYFASVRENEWHVSSDWQPRYLSWRNAWACARLRMTSKFNLSHFRGCNVDTLSCISMFINKGGNAEDRILYGTIETHIQLQLNTLFIVWLSRGQFTWFFHVGYQIRHRKFWPTLMKVLCGYSIPHLINICHTPANRR